MHWPDSLDAAPLGDGRLASAVDRPSTVEELRDLVARRAFEGLAIYPQGGKTSLNHGGIPGRPGVALDLTGLDQVIDYPAADMTITVQAGITLAKLQEVLATEGQFLPLDAPHPGRATLGGIYATNTCGPRRFGWGRPRDMIIGVSFVTGDGKEVKGGGRVVKNVAGYDFPKLITGSMGTLGPITQMTLKVRPKPEASVLAWASLPEGCDLHGLLKSLNTSLTRPTAIAALNRGGQDCTGKPAVPGSAGLLVLGFEDNAASVAWQVQTIKQEIPSLDWSAAEGDAAASLWSNLASFPECDAVNGITIEAHLPRSQGSRFASEIDSLIPSDTLLHAGSGVIVAHLHPERNGMTQTDLLAKIDQLRHRATDLGGGLILLRCPTELKERLKVWGEPRADWSIMQKIKAALDPAGVMNPGRFVGTI